MQLDGQNFGFQKTILKRTAIKTKSGRSFYIVKYKKSDGTVCNLEPCSFYDTHYLLTNGRMAMNHNYTGGSPFFDT